MSEDLHSGMHPDADSLSAFVEGALPEHERLECLAHLAECARCREIVYLAQEPPAEEELRRAPVAADPIPFRKRWFAPLPILAAAATVAIVLFSIGTYRVIRSGEEAPEQTGGAQQVAAAITPAPEIAPKVAAPLLLQEPEKTGPAARPRVTRKPDSIVARAEIANGTAQPAVPAAAAPPLPLALLPLTSPAPPPAANPGVTTEASVSSLTPNKSSTSELAAISGTVTDSSGGVVTGANVTVRPVIGSTSSNAQTDAKGQFNVAGLAPGRYELEFQSPGFKQTSKQIDLQPQEIAKVNSSLEIGAVSETVAVAAAAPALNTESDSVAVSSAKTAGLIAGGAILPDRLPAVTTAASGKFMIAADANGALFLSRNSGKSWKAVKPAWRGKVVRLASPPDAPPTSSALFQLTTDSGAVWLSRDGNHWSPAPSPR